MLICKTPLRLSFLGGGTDFPSWYNENEGRVISTSIDKYCYTILKDLPPLHKFKIRLRYFNEERVNKFSEIKHPVIKAVFQKYFTPKKGKELVYCADVPALSGLGSSSAFTVSMLKLASEYNNEKISKNALARKSIYFEQKILKEYVGSQDQIAAAYGGFNIINFKKNTFKVTPIKIDKKKIHELEESILLVDTNISRLASTLEKEKIMHIKHYENMYRELFLLCKTASAKIYSAKNLQKFLSEYINESWKIKKKLAKNVSNSSIDDLLAFGMKNGAIAGKILGAGSGGFVFFLCKDKIDKERLKKKIKKNISMDIKFNNFGAQIIHNHKFL